MTLKLDLAPYLEQQILEGRAILFLGAGASVGATSSDGKIIAPKGAGLATALSNKFLNGAHSSDSLKRVADYAISESSLGDVQSYIRSLFEPLQPTPAHLLLPEFRWHAIVTTNYDMLVEAAYQKQTDRLQDAVSIIRDEDKIGDVIENPRTIPVLKFHGCITCANDKDLPLVLSNEQYSKHAHGRRRLKEVFSEWAREHPVIFCGYDLQDDHISKILFDLEDNAISRPRYLFVNPTVDEFASRYWSKYRVDAIQMTFIDFVSALSKRLPKGKRTLGSLFSGNHGPISKWLKVGATLTNATQATLHVRLEHVSPGMPLEACTASDFYRGFSDSWSPIATGLDVERRAGAEMLVDWVDAEPNKHGPSFVLLLGYAGSGKTVVLRRIAWEAANRWSRLVFFSSRGLNGVAAAMHEIATATGDRIILIIDDVLDDFDELASALSYWRTNAVPVTVIGGARTNEWNVQSELTSVLPDREYPLRNLSEGEIRLLLAVLEKHQCLGELVKLSFDDRVQLFLKEHDRQILVSLHELTLGKSFREIVRDEWKNVTPSEAQQLYLDVCTLNRFRSPVRAGLISRLSGIRFDDFKSRFFRPLEQVVRTTFDERYRDYVYSARHPHVAELVFDEVLSDPQAKANQIIRVVSHLNPSFDADQHVAGALIRGQTLAEQFSDNTLANRIFDAADQGLLDKSFVRHQQAVFELHHVGGQPGRAIKLADQALSEAKSSLNSAILHTKAAALRRMALTQPYGDAREKYRDDAIELLNRQLKGRTSHAIVTLCEILLDQVTERIETTETSAPKIVEDVVVKKLTDLERYLADGLQRFPQDEHLIRVQASVAKLINGKPAGLAILRRACDKNPGNEMLVCRLVRQLDGAHVDEALGRLRACLKFTPGSKALNFSLGRILMKLGEEEHRVEISAALHRAFSSGDTRFEAQFWYARHEYLYGDRAAGDKIFNAFRLRGVPVSNGGRPRGHVAREGKAIRYRGQIVVLKSEFAFIRAGQLGSDVFLHSSEIADDEWPRVRIGDTYEFAVAFNYRGPLAVQVVRP